MLNNPLLADKELPTFSQIRPEHIKPALEQVLTENRARIASILTYPTAMAWDVLIPPLEMLDDRLQKVWSPVVHLHAVVSSDALRDAYHACLQKITAYHTEFEQNEQLYYVFKQLAEHPSFKELSLAQQKLITNQLRDFHLAGVTLPQAAKKRYADIQTKLAELTAKFEENILDATEGWTYHTTNPAELAGIPEHIISTAEETARQKELSGWLLTLEFPCYFPVISYANNRELRKQLYMAYHTRASDQGPQAGYFDNSKIMAEIAALRRELSTLLGFANYAEISLATKMVKQPQQVLDFLQQLVAKAKPKALIELQELAKFARQSDDINELQPWDIAYYSEKLREQQYGINEEMFRPYFPVERVLQGLFTLTNRLYGMQVKELNNIDTWHPDVRFFAIYDAHDQLRGQFYLDLYARPHKQSGAWMDSYRQRWRHPNGKLQCPIAYLTCNFTSPSSNNTALLTHEEIITLFHEFGHGLHHMLTQVDYASISGIHGVAWDAVELPSQFMEFFAWEKPVLDLISGHYKTAEPLPNDLLQRLRAAKNFQSGLKLLRQLEFSLFDFRLYLNYQPEQNSALIQKILDDVRREVSIIPVPTWNRFQHSFSHIFSGGYAAGYYSYLWAEVLASDAFSKFEETGIFDKTTAQSFLQKILEKGGSMDALELFINFRGRPPKVEALLRHLGITP